MSEVETDVSTEVMQRVFDHFGLRQEVFQESYTLISEPSNYAKFQTI